MNVHSPKSTDSMRPPQQSTAGDSLIKRLGRWRGHFVVGFAIPVAIALAVLLVVRPTYIATGSVMIGEQEPSSSSASPAWIQKLGDPADMESQLLILRSSRMLRLVLNRPGVTDAVKQECRFGAQSPLSLRSAADCDAASFDSRAMLQHVERRVSAQAVGRSRVISIGYESPLPDVAFMMANALLITYLEDQRAQNAQTRSSAAEWILKEAERAAANGADAQLAKYYTDLHKKVSDIETERRILQNGGRLVSLAEVPQLPYFPRRTPLLAAGLTFGLILGVLAALLKDVTDNRVRRSRDLVAATAVPVLGKISRVGYRRKLASALGLVARNKEVNDQLRTLYARLLLRGGEGKNRILVTSTMPGEGKSFTAIALARLAAEGGSRVLLIDCNLRHPGVADALNLENGHGLADVLAGTCQPSEAIQATQTPGLDAVCAGQPSGDPTMLLIDKRMLERLGQINDYDIVIMDGPACDRFADAQILAHQSDEVLWCVRWGHTLLSDVEAGLDSLAGMRQKIAAVITMIDPRQSRRYDRDYQSVSAFKGEPA